MPTADGILSWATSVANEWRPLAIAWRVALGALLAVLGRGATLSLRHVGIVLVLPVASVSTVASLSGNPFNALTFAVLALLLSRAALHLPPTPVTRAAPAWVLAGSVLLVIGSIYPHFLRAETWTDFVYASGSRCHSTAGCSQAQSSWPR